MTDALPDNQSNPPPDEPPRDLREMEGQILAKRYLIQKLLGRGGFGVTFLSRNIYLPGQPLCVVKKLAPKFTNPNLLATARWRFYIEARTLSRLGSHCQIPTLMDYFKIGKDLYLVEEYVPGDTLSKIVRQRRKFNEKEVENFLIHMLRLLQYIHSHKLIHRDIKPQNIILSQTDRRLVLIDFGAVKDLHPPANISRYRAISRAIGTPGYAPPEQLADRPVYGSDIYALGMTCIFLLTGKDPLQFSAHPQTAEIIWQDRVKISPGLAEIVSKMVRVPIVERYQSATQVLNALDNRAIAAKLQAYRDRKQALSDIRSFIIDPDSPFPPYYPPGVRWAIELINE
jgi:serine/threonine-protein kinase